MAAKRRKIQSKPGKPSSPTKRSTLSEKARKAAAKKRAESRIRKKRSEAAKRGWETRRENEREAERKRKAAAKKRAAKKPVKKVSGGTKKKSHGVVGITEQRQEGYDRFRYFQRRDIRKELPALVKGIAAATEKKRQAIADEYFEKFARRLNRMTRAEVLSVFDDETAEKLRRSKLPLREIRPIALKFQANVLEAQIAIKREETELAAQLTRHSIEQDVFSTPKQVLQKVKSTAEKLQGILDQISDFEVVKLPDQEAYELLSRVYGTADFEPMVEVCAERFGLSSRELYSMFFSPDAEVFQ